MLTGNGLTSLVLKQKLLAMLQKQAPAEEVKAVYIPDALLCDAQDGEHDPTAVARQETVMEELRSLGVLQVMRVELRTQPRDALARLLDGVHLLYVDWGNTFYLRHQMRVSGFDELAPAMVRAGRCIYVGASSGSICAGRSVEPAFWKGWDFPGHGTSWDLSSAGYGGLDLLPGGASVFPHFAAKHVELVQRRSGELDHEVVCIADRQAFVVDDNEVELVPPEKAWGSEHRLSLASTEGLGASGSATSLGSPPWTLSRGSADFSPRSASEPSSPGAEPASTANSPSRSPSVSRSRPRSHGAHAQPGRALRAERALEDALGEPRAPSRAVASCFFFPLQDILGEQLAQSWAGRFQPPVEEVDIDDLDIDDIDIDEDLASSPPLAPMAAVPGNHGSHVPAAASRPALGSVSCSRPLPSSLRPEAVRPVQPVQPAQPLLWTQSTISPHGSSPLRYRSSSAPLSWPQSSSERRLVPQQPSAPYVPSWTPPQQRLPAAVRRYATPPTASFDALQQIPPPVSRGSFLPPRRQL